MEGYVFNSRVCIVYWAMCFCLSVPPKPHALYMCTYNTLVAMATAKHGHQDSYMQFDSQNEWRSNTE